MHYAIDTRTKRLVHAQDGSRSRQYLCPVCSKAALLKAGRIQRRYFAHWPGEGSEECENYHPPPKGNPAETHTTVPHTGPGGKQWKGASADGVQVFRQFPTPLSLYLFRSTQDPLSWGLEIAVPQAPSREGYVCVDSVQGLVQLPLSNLAQGSRRVSVRPQSQAYQLKPSEQVASEYAARITTLIPGLQDTKGNVFRYADHGGARVRGNQPLHWGQAYYIVWANHLRCDFPSGIAHRQLADSPPWKCAEIELPCDLDHSVALWVAQFLERYVERPPVSLVLVTPPVRQYTEDDALVVADDAEVIIGVVGEPGARITENLLVRLPGTESCHMLSLPDEPPLLLALGRLPLGVTTVYFPKHTEASLRLIVQSSPEPMNLRAVELVFRDVTTQQVESLSAFCPLASSALQHVQHGSKELVEIQLPTIVPFHLLTRQTKSLAWKDTFFSAYPEEAEETFRDRLCQEINSALIEKDILVILDFGNYGQPITVEGSYGFPRFQQLTLPAGLRMRLEWVLSFAYTHPTPSGVCTGALWWLQNQFRHGRKLSMELQSKYLIQRLLRTRALPDSMAPHLRVIAREIRQWLEN